MASTFTPNIQLEEPARGDDVGVWDTPVNSNMTVVDRVVGQITTIGLNNTTVVLTAAQYQSKTLIFNSTLTGNVLVSFPSSFTKSYEVLNNCTGIASFTILLVIAGGIGQNIAVPPGDMIECYNDGTNMKYKNFGRIGSYWDYAGSSVPNWVTACTVPPYLNCDGSAFNSGTYPTLAVILPFNVLPDARGRNRAALNQGTGRMTTAAGGVDGNTLLAGGGADTETLTLAQLPGGIASNGNNSISVTNNSNGIPYGPSFTTVPTGTGGFNGPGTNGAIGFGTGNFTAAGLNAISVVSNNTGGAGHPIMQPTLVAGLTMIRAA